LQKYSGDRNQRDKLNNLEGNRHEKTLHYFAYCIYSDRVRR
jgi:hypothetical protein